MNRQLQELRDYLQTAERGFASMRRQSPEVARVGYRAGKMFMRAKDMLDQATVEMELEPGLVLESVPPDPPEQNGPKNAPRKKRI